MNEKYLKILDLVRSKDECDPEWVQKPHNVLDKTCATDKHIAVFTPQFGLFDDFTKKYHPHLYPFPATHHQHIIVSDIKSALSKLPQEDCYDEEFIECGACEGEAEVEYEFQYKKKTYTAYLDCPVCNGEGGFDKKSDKLTGQKYFPETHAVKIGNSLFLGKILLRIIEICEILGVDNINLLSQTFPTKPTTFKAGEVEMLCMPAVGHNSELEIVEEIVLKPNHVQ